MNVPLKREPAEGASEHELGIDLFTRMLRIRRFEERCRALVAAGEVSAAHLYLGQEAVAAGACAALRDDDYITSTHRCHGHILAKGADLGRCMAEMFGRETGYCRGKGGEMHIADTALGILGANGIVGAGIPIATGAALAARLRGGDQVSVPFFGDGAASGGAFHESLNLAAVWSLPVIFLCETNGWSELTPMNRVTARAAIAQHAEGYGLPGVTVDGNDALAVHAATSEAVARAREGGGPTLIEAVTYRVAEHGVGLDAMVGLAREEELAHWRSHDPIEKLRATLLQEGADASTLDAIDERERAAVEAAVAFARESAAPPVESAFTDVWFEQPAIAAGGRAS